MLQETGRIRIHEWDLLFWRGRKRLDKTRRIAGHTDTSFSGIEKRTATIRCDGKQPFGCVRENPYIQYRFHGTCRKIFQKMKKRNAEMTFAQLEQRLMCVTESFREPHIPQIHRG